MIEHINTCFDNRIQRYERTKDVEGKALAEVDKILFNLTKDFDLNDWRKVRADKYWMINDDLPNEFCRKHYLLIRVKVYLKTKK